MKQPDLTSKIMSKVARFESNRIRIFRRRFLTVLLIVAGLLVLTVFVVGWQLYQMQALDVLTLFSEDWQIITEYWQDTLSVFWEQVPLEWFLVGVLSLVNIGGIIFITRKRRAANKKKLSQISQYS